MLLSPNFWLGVVALVVALLFLFTTPFTLLSTVVWIITVIMGVVNLVVAYMYEK